MSLQLTKGRIGPQIVVAVLITAAAIGAVMYATWQDDSWTALRRLDPRLLGGAIGLLVLGWVVDGWRMQAMTRALSYRIPFPVALRTNLLGYFLSAITPFTAGGGALQVYSLARAGLAVGHGTAAVLVSGFVSQLGLALTGVVIVFGFNVTVLGDARLEQLIRIGVIVYAAVVLSLVLATWHIDKGRKFIRILINASRKFVRDEGKVKNWAETVDQTVIDLHKGMHEMFGRRSPWALLGVGLSVGFYVIQFAVVPVLALGLGATVPFVDAIAVQVPIHLLASVLPTPGGSGGLEFGLAAALLRFVSGAHVGVLVVVWRLITFYFVLGVGGVVAISFARFEWHRISAARESDEPAPPISPAPAPVRQTPPKDRIPSGPPPAPIVSQDTATRSDVPQKHNLDQY